MIHLFQPLCQPTEAVMIAKNEAHCIRKPLQGIVTFLTMMIFYIGLSMVPTVQAEPTEPPWGKIVNALEDIATAQKESAKAQTEIATVVKNMTAENSPFSVLLTRMKEDSDMMRCYLAGQPPNCEQTPQMKGLGFAMFMGAVAQAMKKQEEALNEAVCKKNKAEDKPCSPSPSDNTVDPIAGLASMLTLIHRLRTDSDSVRIENNKPDGSGLITPDFGKTTKAIKEALELIHTALAAVPHMANEMHIMNMYMSVMSRDMDSTMGRMGRMMPGGWW